MHFSKARSSWFFPSGRRRTKKGDAPSGVRKMPAEPSLTPGPRARPSSCEAQGTDSQVQEALNECWVDSTNLRASRVETPNCYLHPNCLYTPTKQRLKPAPATPGQSPSTSLVPALQHIQIGAHISSHDPKVITYSTPPYTAKPCPLQTKLRSSRHRLTSWFLFLHIKALGPRRGLENLEALWV